VRFAGPQLKEGHDARPWKYAAESLRAYGVSLVLLAGLVVLSLRKGQARHTAK